MLKSANKNNLLAGVEELLLPSPTPLPQEPTHRLSAQQWNLAKWIAKQQSQLMKTTFWRHGTKQVKGLIKEIGAVLWRNDL